MQTENEKMRTRIEKDIKSFNENLKNTKTGSIEMLKVVDIAKMYAQDAKSYLDKNDLYTSFSCISYAHGLLDAVKRMMGEE